MRSRLAKRLLDIAGATIGLVAAAPLMVASAAVIRATIGRPVIFRQERPGLFSRPFGILKFRTMTDRRDERGELLPDGERLTRMGCFLRATSLDELPELFNVLRGEMSLVGPRPLLMQYLDLYSPEQARRHDVKPGITGWAQINGRNALTWEEKFELDVWYVDNWSLWLDLRILVATIVTVLTRQGISEEGSATMTPFRGSESGA